MQVSRIAYRKLVSYKKRVEHTRQSNLCITMINNDYYSKKGYFCAIYSYLTDSLDNFSNTMSEKLCYGTKNFYMEMHKKSKKLKKLNENSYKTRLFWCAVLLFSVSIFFSCFKEQIKKVFFSQVSINAIQQLQMTTTLKLFSRRTFFYHLWILF